MFVPSRGGIWAQHAAGLSKLRLREMRRKSRTRNLAATSWRVRFISTQSRAREQAVRTRGRQRPSQNPSVPSAPSRSRLRVCCRDSCVLTRLHSCRAESACWHFGQPNYSRRSTLGACATACRCGDIPERHLVPAKLSPLVYTRGSDLLATPDENQVHQR